MGRITVETGSNAIGNGDLLLAAVAASADATRRNGCEIIVPPGEYNIRDETIVMRPYTVLRGTGAATVVSGTGVDALLRGADFSEVRDILLLAQGSGQNDVLTIDNAGTSPRFMDVTAQAFGRGTNVVMRNSNDPNRRITQPYMRECRLTAKGGTHSTCVENLGKVDFLCLRTYFSAVNSDLNDGIVYRLDGIRGTKMKLWDVIVAAYGKTGSWPQDQSVARGIVFRDVGGVRKRLNLFSVDTMAENAGGGNIGLIAENVLLEMFQGRASGKGAGEEENDIGIEFGNKSRVKVHGTVVEGHRAALGKGNGRFSAGCSQLIGSVVTEDSSRSKCAGCYDQAMRFFGDSCPE